MHNSLITPRESGPQITHSNAPRFEPTNGVARQHNKSGQMLGENAALGGNGIILKSRIHPPQIIRDDEYKEREVYRHGQNGYSCYKNRADSI